MKLLFKQRFFSWLDSYDIYDESGETVYQVKGRFALGHCLEIYDRSGAHVGTVKEEVLTFLPRFAMYERGRHIGDITKEFTFFKPKFSLDFNGWEVEGDIFEWDYRVEDGAGRERMRAGKQIWKLSDTYEMDVADPADALICLMIVLAIDAAKCSSGD